MVDQVTYIVVDIETDGPSPGRHAMRNLSAVAADEVGNEVASFSVNITPSLDTSPDPETLSWWENQNADIWRKIAENTVSSIDAIERFDAFVRSFSG